MHTMRTYVAGILLVLGLVGLLAGVLTAPLQAQEQNLLVNSGFEASYKNGVANGWSSWYENSGDLCNTKPDGWNFVCKPNWSEEGDYSHLGLTRGGLSQHVGVQYITWHGGVYQTVSVPAGSRVRFSAWGYSRASNEQPPDPSMGGEWSPRMQVGIDPEGNGQWNSGVVWSGEVNVNDSWQQLSLEVTAGASGKVTVFVSSQFRNAMPLAHMDTWWDEASLVVISPPTATPAPTQVPPTAMPTSAAPVATPTPRPDGATVHVVQSGDTLFGIALEYNVDVEELRRLNAGTLGENDMLSIGQEVVISAASAVAPTPTPEPTQVQPADQVTPGTTAPQATQLPGQDSSLASLCVSAYNDRSGDMMQQADTEELLPNAALTLVSDSGPAGTYTTDGLSEPYCFQNLQPGNYVLRQTPPTGYAIEGPGEWGITLGAGQVYALQLSYVRQTAGEATPQTTGEPQEAETEEESAGGLPAILNTVVRVSAIIVLALLLVIAGVFVLSRRH